MESLNKPLQTFPTSHQLRNAIVAHLWGPPPEKLFNGEPGSQLDLDMYFKYYNYQCGLALHDYGNHISARTHQEIMNVAQHLKEPLRRGEIQALLPKPTPPNEIEKLDGSINLAARLLLMIDFGSLQYGFSSRKRLIWDDNSLKEFIGSYFGRTLALGHERVNLEKIFNARNLGQIAGIEVLWTDNLADHLRISDEDKKVAVFHYASFLEYQQDKPIFPPGLIDETLRTLALLFPQSDKDTRKWIQKLSISYNLDRRLLRCGHLRADDRQIENFIFWHDRLVILKQIFDEARPNTLPQWWSDRRNGVQWYTFWVAALILFLTIFFGFVQCIEGALQVYKAYHPT